MENKQMEVPTKLQTIDVFHNEYEAVGKLDSRRSSHHSVRRVKMSPRLKQAFP